MSIISRPEFMVKVNKISEKFTEDRENFMTSKDFKPRTRGKSLGALHHFLNFFSYNFH